MISNAKLKRVLEDWVIDNGTYKIVALFITLSLWVFIFEKQIAVVSKTVKMDFILARRADLIILKPFFLLPPL